MAICVIKTTSVSQAAAETLFLSLIDAVSLPLVITVLAVTLLATILTDTTMVRTNFQAKLILNCKISHRKKTRKSMLPTMNKRRSNYTRILTTLIANWRDHVPTTASETSVMISFASWMANAAVDVAHKSSRKVIIAVQPCLLETTALGL